MQLTPEQKAAIEQQKAQCIFCQIIEGKIPSKKVYEDKLVVGLLDINPASKGHVLFMPKEHYPVMPMIPPDTFKHMFSKLNDVDKCIKDAMLCKETTIFVANGGAAGQQSAHFMLHIIPRDSGDGLNALDVPGKTSPDGEIKEVYEQVGKILNAMLHKNLPILGYTKPSKATQKVTKEQLVQIILTNPQIKQLVLSSPEQFKQLIPSHPQLQQLFADQDVDAVIQEVIAIAGDQK